MNYSTTVVRKEINKSFKVHQETCVNINNETSETDDRGCKPGRVPVNENKRRTYIQCEKTKKRTEFYKTTFYL